MTWSKTLPTYKLMYLPKDNGNALILIKCKTY